MLDGLKFCIRCSVTVLLLLGCPFDARSEEQPLLSAPQQDKIICPSGVDRLVSESNREGLRLVANLVESRKSDVVISPASSTMVHLILLNGLSGSNRTDLAHAMGLGLKGNEDPAALSSSFIRALSSSEPKCDVGAAIAFGSQLSIRPEYAKVVQHRLGGMVAAADQFEALCRFIKSKTANRFGDAMEKPEPSALKLFSTAYFKGVWSNEFYVVETKTEPFHRLDGSTVPVSMMHKHYYGSMQYLRGGNFQALRLPYLPSRDVDNVNCAMYIFLPNQGVSLDQFLEQISKTGLNEYSSMWEVKSGDLSIPRFRIQNKEVEIPLPSGDGKPIDVKALDLAAMLSTTERPELIESKQSTSIDFNEKGTEAIAYNEFNVLLGGDINAFNMKVDRPFAFVLGDSRTGIFLFAGAVLDPKDSKLSFDKAEEEWLKRVPLLDKSDYHYTMTMWDFAEFYRQAAKFEKAEAILLEMSKFKIYKKAGPYENPFDLNRLQPIKKKTPSFNPDGTKFVQRRSLEKLAQVFAEDKKYAKSEQVYKDLLLIYKCESSKNKDRLFDECFSPNPTFDYIRCLKNYAGLLALMNASLLPANSELERLYKQQVSWHSKELSFSKAKSSEKEWAAEDLARAKKDLAEFYLRNGRKAEALDNFAGAIASGCASPAPNYSLLIKIGNTYVKQLRESKKNAEAKKIESLMRTWAELSNSSRRKLKEAD